MGLIIFLGNLDIINADFTLFIIGGGFFLAYFLSGKSSKERKVAFLIVSALILMLGIFDILDNYIAAELSACLFFALMGTAFLLIYIIHTFHNEKGSKWPLYIAIIIYAFSLFVYLVEVVNFYIIKEYAERYWPLLFIIIGAIVLIKGLRSNQFEKKRIE